jgi:hypothetical protein
MSLGLSRRGGEVFVNTIHRKDAEEAEVRRGTEKFTSNDF